MALSDLRADLSDEELELLHTLDRLFLLRSEWASYRDHVADPANITHEFADDGRSHSER